MSLRSTVAWFAASSALFGCSPSDLDDLCREAEALRVDAKVPIAARPAALLSAWEPSSRGGLAIKEGMYKDGEVRSVASFRKIVEARTSKAWSCEAVEEVLSAPVIADAEAICAVSAAVVGARGDGAGLVEALKERWSPASAWGRAVAEGIGGRAIAELPAALAKSFQEETGLPWRCEAIEGAVAASLKAEVSRWCELATMVEASPTANKPVHLRRAKMHQLVGRDLGGDLAALRGRFAAAGAPPCASLERVLGLAPEGLFLEDVPKDTPEATPTVE
jgi:hypothetical protein